MATTQAAIEMQPSPRTSPRLGTPEHKASAISSVKPKRKGGLGGKLDHYFHGPRDISRHSKIPFFFRIHGSIIPHLILPLIFIVLWSWLVVAIIKKYFLCQRDSAGNIKWKDPTARYKECIPTSHKFDSILLTVMGFLVGIAISFRNATAYERYNDGRKYWSQLTLTCENLARVIWVHGVEREETPKEDLLAKITSLNLIVAFALALKHRLRFEPYMDYDDMRGYVDFLDTYARDANVGVDSTPPKPNQFQRLGEIFGLTIAQTNPRVMLKTAQRPLGNLPLEILTYLQGYIDSIILNGTFKTPIFQVQALTSLSTLNDVLCGTDRILNTPLPVAYSITIAQISWVYILLLPFQLVTRLSWNTIPATMLAAYIILGFGLIGREIENPFGREVNDLPLESFCDQIAYDIDVIMSKPAPKPSEFVLRGDNMPLYPLSMAGYAEWIERPVEDLRAALKTKVLARTGSRQGRGYDGADSRE